VDYDVLSPELTVFEDFPADFAWMFLDQVRHFHVSENHSTSWLGDGTQITTVKLTFKVDEVNVHVMSENIFN
jgi:hypothetical protein